MSGKPETSGKSESKNKTNKKSKSPSPPKVVRAAPGNMVAAGITAHSKVQVNAPRASSPTKVKNFTKRKNRKNKMRKTSRK
jgi:hypothetical protein